MTVYVLSVVDAADNECIPCDLASWGIRIHIGGFSELCVTLFGYFGSPMMSVICFLEESEFSIGGFPKCVNSFP